MLILRRPRISEKSMNLTKEGLYTFEVALNASKEQIAKIVAEKFDVKVVSVKTINVKRRTKTQRTRRGSFSVSPIKKAYVQVKKGQKIALFEQAPKEEVEVTTGEEVKEKKSLLKRSKVKIEKVKSEQGTVKSEKTKKETKQKTAKQKSIAKKKGAK